jgi:hypothetical protein
MPSRNQVHIDAALTNLSIAYRNPEYIAHEVLPVVPVTKDSDKYFVYGKENFNLENTRRKADAKANQASYTLSDEAYSTERHALRDFVSDDEVQNSDPALDPFGDRTMNLTDRLLLRREYDAAQVAFNTTAMSGHTAALSGTAMWDDDGSDPVEAVEAKRLEIVRQTGVRPNKLILGADVYAALTGNAAIKDRIKYTQLGVVDEQLLAKLFKVDKVVVGNAVYNSAKEGQATSLTSIWGKLALLAYVAPRPGLKTVSLAYTFQSKNLVVKRYQESGLEGDWVEVEEKRDQKLIAPAAGFLWSNAVA